MPKIVREAPKFLLSAPHLDSPAGICQASATADERKGRNEASGRQLFLNLGNRTKNDDELALVEAKLDCDGLRQRSFSPAMAPVPQISPLAPPSLVLPSGRCSQRGPLFSGKFITGKLPVIDHCFWHILGAESLDTNPCEDVRLHHFERTRRADSASWPPRPNPRRHRGSSPNNLVATSSSSSWLFTQYKH